MAEELVLVDAKALREVLQALASPGHMMRELQATRSLHKLGHPNPIDTLLEQLEVGQRSAGTAALLSESERTELLDWVNACQSQYHIDSTQGHRFAELTSNLQENRTALLGYVNELLEKRAGRTSISPGSVAAEGSRDPA